ncbi:MAG: NlpC/P60 family protein [Pseudomonadota bacterium]
MAHRSLAGKITAERFVDGDACAVAVASLPLCRSPDGPRDREILCGEQFVVLEWPEDMSNGWAYGFLERDGYCGYVHVHFLRPASVATHRVAVRETYRKETPDLKKTERTLPLFLGSRVCVKDIVGDWAEIALRLGGPGADRVFDYYVPAAHLKPVDEPETDPVDVARRFLGTPYLWGGNSARGIDCSGIVQAAFLACGWACPGDSDLQEAMPGTRLPDAHALEAGDLLFWRGHVAMVAGPDSMLHANAHHMMVVEEPISDAIHRIAATDTGPVTTRLRPDRRRWTPVF